MAGEAGSRLSALIAALYDRVPGKVSSGLEVCHCPVCMTEETRQQIIATPMRAMPAELIREYSNSAHSVPVNLDDLRAFLPRYLELIAADEEVDYNSVGCELLRFGQARAEHPDLWDPETTALLEACGTALLELTLETFGTSDALCASPGYMLDMLTAGGWDAAALCAHLDRRLSEPGAVERVLPGLVLWLADSVGGGKVDFWASETYRPDAAAILQAWVRRQTGTEAMWDLATGPELDRMLNSAGMQPDLADMLRAFIAERGSPPAT